MYWSRNRGDSRYVNRRKRNASHWLAEFAASIETRKRKLLTLDSCGDRRLGSPPAIRTSWRAHSYATASQLWNRKKPHVSLLRTVLAGSVVPKKESTNEMAPVPIRQLSYYYPESRHHQDIYTFVLSQNLCSEAFQNRQWRNDGARGQLGTVLHLRHGSPVQSSCQILEFIRDRLPRLLHQCSAFVSRASILWPDPWCISIVASDPMVASLQLPWRTKIKVIDILLLGSVYVDLQAMTVELRSWWKIKGA